MLRLDLSPDPRWIDLGHGVRVRAFPLSSAVMLAARRDPAVVAVANDPDADEGAASHVVATAIARAVIKDWEGVGDAEGNPVPVTPEGIDALLALWPMFEAFQLRYLAGGMLLDAEKNVSSPLPNGNSAGATDIAPPARKSAKPARRKQIAR